LWETLGIKSSVFLVAQRTLFETTSKGSSLTPKQKRRWWRRSERTRSCSAVAAVGADQRIFRFGKRFFYGLDAGFEVRRC